MTGAVTVLTVLIAIACGGGDSPTTTVAQEGSGGSEVPAVPTSTVAQDSSGGSDLTESKHTAYCREIISAIEEEGSIDETMTWGEVAQSGGRVIDRIEDITAPEELKDYHSALIAFVKAYNEFYGR